MAGLLFVVFWAAAYSAAWWGAPYLGKFLPVTSPTAFNVIRVVLSIVFCLVVSIGVIFRDVLIYFVDGVDPGPPMGGGPVVAAIVFGSRLGASRDPEQSSLPGSSSARPKPGGLDQGSSASSNPTFPSNPGPSQIATGGVTGTRMSDAQSRDNLAPQKSEGVSSQRGEDMRDPFAIAGEELLSGSVEPAAWARALVDGEEQGDAFKARYIRERVNAIQQERRRWEAKSKKVKKAITDIATNMGVIQDEISQFASLRGVSEDEAKVMAAYKIYKNASNFLVYTDGIEHIQSFGSVWSAALFASRVHPPVPRGDLPYRFKESDLTVYGNKQLDLLRNHIQNFDETSLVKIRDAILGKIGWDSWNAHSWSVKAFLEEYYRQLRESLEIMPR